MTVIEGGNWRSTRRALLAIVCLFVAWNPVIGSATPPAVQTSVAGASEVREFDILVDGKPAGSHRLKISSQDDVTTVRVESDVKIDFVVYVYTYKFRATEVWRKDVLTQIDAQCEDGGKRTTLTAKSDETRCQVVLNGRELVTGRSAMTTAYWRLPLMSDQQREVSILDVESGIAKLGTVEQMGRVKLKAEGRSMACRHFKVSGSSPAELWFDEQDRLVRQKSVEDGHRLELRLKRIRDQAAE